MEDAGTRGSFAGWREIDNERFPCRLADFFQTANEKRRAEPYPFTTHNGSIVRRWHPTVVYRDGAAGWKIIHSHFSQVGP